jgi:Na+/melibiose symporter-like transporter
MNNDHKYKRTGSAWNFLFGIAGLFILFFAFPLFALNGSIHDTIDNWTSDINNQVTIVMAVCCIGLILAARYLYKKLKRAE